MTAPTTAKILKYIKYAMIALVVVLFLLTVLFVWDYVSLTRARIINDREMELSTIVRNHGPLTANDVGLVRPWMTFDYINTLFKIPPDYLRAQLSITDTSYPRLSLSGYAKYQQTSTAVVLAAVESSLTTYLNAQAPVSTSTIGNSTTK